MALQSPITISDEAKILQQVLNDWAITFGGKASIVSNLRDFWNQSSINSEVPRILICYNGETSRGSFSQIATWHRVDRQWTVAVTKGRGYYPERGDGLMENTSAELPLFDVLEIVRDLIRSISNISEETPAVDYKAIKPMQLGNLVVDGYTIEFSTANDIPSNLTTTTTETT